MCCPAERVTLAQKKLTERRRKYIVKNSKSAQDEENVLQPRPAGDREPQGRGAGLARGPRGGTSFPRRAPTAATALPLPGSGRPPGRAHSPGQSGGRSCVPRPPLARRSRGAEEAEPAASPAAPRRRSFRAGPAQSAAAAPPARPPRGSRRDGAGAQGDPSRAARRAQRTAGGSPRISEHAGLARPVGVSLTAQKAAGILGCIQSSVVKRVTDGIRPLCSGGTPPGTLHQLGGPQHGKDIGPIGKGPKVRSDIKSRNTSPMKIGLESWACLTWRSFCGNLIEANQYVMEAYKIEENGTFCKGV